MKPWQLIFLVALGFVAIAVSIFASGIQITSIQTTLLVFLFAIVIIVVLVLSYSGRKVEKTDMLKIEQKMMDWWKEKTGGEELTWERGSGDTVVDFKSGRKMLFHECMFERLDGDNKGKLVLIKWNVTDDHLWTWKERPSPVEQLKRFKEFSSTTKERIVIPKKRSLVSIYGAQNQTGDESRFDKGESGSAVKKDDNE